MSVTAGIFFDKPKEGVALVEFRFWTCLQCNESFSIQAGLKPKGCPCCAFIFTEWKSYDGPEDPDGLSITVTP